MVMMFKSDKAFTFLKERGFVFSFRSKKRKRTGKNWVNRGYGKEKEFNVIIREVEEVPFFHDIRRFAPFSGFKDWEAWYDAIVELHGEVGREDGRVGWLYLVVKEGKE